MVEMRSDVPSRSSVVMSMILPLEGVDGAAFHAARANLRPLGVSQNAISLPRSRERRPDGAMISRRWSLAHGKS